MSLQFNMSNMRLAPALVSYHTKILKGLVFNNRAEKTRSFLSSSPVKMLSSILTGGGGGGGSGSYESTYPAPGPKHQRTPLGSVFAQPGLLARSNSIQKDNSSIFGSWKSRDGDKGRAAVEEGRPENPLFRLEQTFSGYIGCLRSRKGNIIGRSLLNRNCVDELTVNELYNRLIENPHDIEASSDRSFEAIFVSFEKFLRFAWMGQMGPIISIDALDALQQRASRNLPGNFADFVNFLFADMAPQNRRAFAALIKLLADLLDGCGNDSDRGALTIAFAEILVTDGSAHAYINLLDRLVEDCERIFEDIKFGSGVNLSYSTYDHAVIRGGKSQTGSMTSNTSSLRRKFGLESLLKPNSKNDENRSMWRSLSKRGRSPDTGDATPYGSIRASVNRSRSIESHGGSSSKLQRRPGSRDKPPVPVTVDDFFQRPASSHRLETIGEPDTEQQQPAQTKTKKKRRSSLSDLKSLMSQVTLGDEPPLMPLPVNKQTSEKFNSTSRGPDPPGMPVSAGANQTLHAANSRQKENIQDIFSQPWTASESGGRITSHTKTLSMTQIPTLRPRRGGGIETPSRIPTGPTRSGTAASSNAPGGKLRLQSPQKLRERLQTERRVAGDQDAQLKSELSRIAEDMARVNNNLPHPAEATTNSFGTSSGSIGGGKNNNLSKHKGAAPTAAETRRLTIRLEQLEKKIDTHMSEAASQRAKFSEDMDAVLKAQEQKVKAIDQLYKETAAENELLYEKFNSELGRILKALRAKRGSEEREEVVAQMREQVGELARVKKENMRLKRDMASLRGLVRGMETGAGQGQ